MVVDELGIVAGPKDQQGRGCLLLVLWLDVLRGRESSIL